MKGHVGKLVAYFVVIAALITAGISIPYWFGGSWMPDLIDTEGSRIDQLFWGLVILSIVILAIVMTIVIYSIRHFVAKPGDDDDAEGEPIHGNHRIEIVWTVVPAIIVVVVGMLSFNVLSTNEQAPAKGKPAMSVFVRGFSFGWKFAYTPKLYTIEQVHQLELAGHGPVLDKPESADLVIPINTTIRFHAMSCSRQEGLTPQREGDKIVELKSTCYRRYGKPVGAVVTEKGFIPGQEADVNHSFWVPEARLKIDTISGLSSWVQWTPTKLTGADEHLQVVCAFLCGSGHNTMRADVCVVPGAVYTWWQGKLTDTSSVPCTHLRLFTCTTASDYDTLDTVAGAVLTKNPDARCDDFTKTLKEQA